LNFFFSNYQEACLQKKMRLCLLLLFIDLVIGLYDPRQVETEVVLPELRFLYQGKRISPWHDIPFLAVGNDETSLLSFVCEIPLGTRQKMEIHKSLKMNPMVQDKFKDGSPRYYKYSPSIVNYGAIPQTWENPDFLDPDTGLGGDNDPIDVLQLNEKSCERGAVQRVRVLGALALIDDGETDWKLLVVDVDDSSNATTWKQLSDIPTERIDQVTDWFRVYKMIEGKPMNKYAFNDKPVDAQHALRVAKQT